MLEKGYIFWGYFDKKWQLVVLLLVSMIMIMVVMPLVVILVILIIKITTSMAKSVFPNHSWNDRGNNDVQKADLWFQWSWKYHDTIMVIMVIPAPLQEQVGAYKTSIQEQCWTPKWSRTVQNNLANQGQWPHPRSSTPTETTPRRIFDANSVISNNVRIYRADKLKFTGRRTDRQTDRLAERRTYVGNDNTPSDWMAKRQRIVTS